MIFLDPRGQMVEVNPRLAEMLGCSADALRGRSVATILHPEELPKNLQLRRELLSPASPRCSWSRCACGRSPAASCRRGSSPR